MVSRLMPGFIGKVSKSAAILIPVTRKKIDLDIDIQSDQSATDLTRLVKAAKEGRFAEQSIELAFPIGHRLKVDGNWVEV